MSWRRLSRVFITLGIAYLTLMLLVVLFEDGLLYHPTRGGRVAAPGKEVWLRTRDGVALHAHYAALDPQLPTLIYLHGTAGNLASRSDRLVMFTTLGANLLALDYRGYGRSGGTPSEAGLYLDAHAAYDWAAERGDPHKIVLLGQSLGGGPACELAATRAVGGLILLSTFTSVPDIATRLLPWLPMRQLLRTRFDNRARVARVPAPKLFIHSRKDQVVPFDMAQQLFETAPAPKQHLWLTRANHDGTFYTERELSLATIRRFIGTLR